MKKNICIKSITGSLLAVAALLLTSAASHAALFNVSINTAALNLPPANANAPFSLYFQYADGGLLGNNTATISNFTYGGGAATGSAITLGGALGDIGSTVTFNNNSFIQELWQTFTVGTRIDFNVSLTENSDGLTPDSFSVGILDTTLANITTNGIGDSLFQANVTPGLTITPANFSSGTGDFAGVVAAVPEPATAESFSSAVVMFI